MCSSAVIPGSRFLTRKSEPGGHFDGLFTVTFGFVLTIGVVLLIANVAGEGITCPRCGKWNPEAGEHLRDVPVATSTEQPHLGIQPRSRSRPSSITSFWRIATSAADGSASSSCAGAWPRDASHATRTYMPGLRSPSWIDQVSRMPGPIAVA